ncbi:MAG: prepilin-type N-terminal cleavage/methylation domain-containing protein [Candidatus Omnitrophica bacterium]|nr:prepilin-type N-terminal cleavage/methylation domain-containing protein [Candidatus Omnitrophota bacterium]
MIHRGRKGFTLLEIMTVIIIVGILATIGFTHYGGVKENALNREAVANLRLIQAAEKIYRMENGSYIACACSSTACSSIASPGCNYLLKLSLTAQNWAYAVDASGTATARRTAVIGGTSKTRTYTLTINALEPSCNGC